MTDGEFIATYPCYILLAAPDCPEFLTVDETDCLCLFFSHEAAARFHNDRYGAGAKRNLDALSIPDGESLIAQLEAMKGELAQLGIHHVSLDFNPGNVAYCPIDDLLDEIKRQENAASATRDPDT